MIIDKILLSLKQPSRTDIAWAKPFPEGFALYLYYNGKWQPQLVVNDKDNYNPDDDQPYDLDAIGASKLSELDDVSLNSLSNGQILKYNGSTWENENDDTSTPGPNTVGTEQIIDNSVEMEDLNDSVKGKIQKTYDISDESLNMDFDVVP